MSQIGLQDTNKAPELKQYHNMDLKMIQHDVLQALETYYYQHSGNANMLISV